MTTQQTYAVADLPRLTDQQVGEMFELACELASDMYDAKQDTSFIDSQVDLILAELQSRNLA